MDMFFLALAAGHEHKDYNGCNAPDYELYSERKLGLNSVVQCICKSCGFITKKLNFNKAAVDSKSADVNVLYATALMDQPIGVEKANLLLTQMDLQVPSRSHLQTLVNKASANVQELNKVDMAEKRQLMIQHNIDSGAVNPRQIDVSFDGRYNATRLVSSYKPGQASSQAYGVAIENHTRYKYIIGLAVENKLCYLGAHLRNRGFEVNCPGGHANCTATVDYMTPHSERNMAYDIAEQLSSEDILVRRLTTDGDAKAHLGMQDFYNQLGNAWNVERQADPNHLGNVQMRRARSATWSSGMFPGKTTRAAKQRASAVLAKDIRNRCMTVVDKLLRDLGNNDLTAVVDQLPRVKAATLQCYKGNCSFCPHDSLVCSGGLNGEDWFYKSAFLPTHDIHRLQMTDSDGDLMSTILEVCLSEKALLSLRSKTSTQKCEAFNRATLSTMPKELNRSRNFAGTLASKTLQINNSLEVSVKKKFTSVTGRCLSAKSAGYLGTRSKRYKSHQKYQKTRAFKARRHFNRARLERKYHCKRSGLAEDAESPDYCQGQFDH